MPRMKKNTRSALRALKLYAQLDRGTRNEPKDWQASDMITELLLAFPDEAAQQILHRVERDYSAERGDVPAVLDVEV